MAYSSSFADRLRRSRERMHRAADYNLMVPTAAATPLPYFEMPQLLGVPLFIAVAGGFRQAFHNDLARKAMAPPAPDSKYSLQSLKSGLRDGLSIGMGLEFSDWKDGLEYAKSQQETWSIKDEKRYWYSRYRDMSPMVFSNKNLTSHCCWMGSTGSGKTEAMLAMAAQQFQKGQGMLIFEAKEDRELVEKIYAMAEMYGLGHKVKALGPHTYNPWGGDDIRSLISMTSKLKAQSKGDPFWEGVSIEGMTQVMTALLRQRNRKRFNFKDLYAIFSQPENLIRLHANMSEEDSEARADKVSVGNFIRSFIVQDRKSNDPDAVMFASERWSQLYKGTISTLTPFANSAYGTSLNSYAPDIDILNAIEQGEIIIISASTLKDATGTELLGRIVLADVAKAIGTIQERKTKSMIPYLIWLDEYGSFKHGDHQALFQLARSAGISLHISIQGEGFIAEESETFANNLTSNCHNHIFYDIRDNVTKKKAMDSAGTVMRMLRQDSSSTNTGKSHDVTEPGFIGGESHGQGESVGYRETREDLLQPEDLNLEEGDALVIGKQQTYRVRLPIVLFDEDTQSYEDIPWMRTDDGDSTYLGYDFLGQQNASEDYTYLIKT